MTLSLVLACAFRAAATSASAQTSEPAGWAGFSVPDPGPGRAALPAGRSQPRIVVVGAGLSGLAAALELKERYGLEAQVFEARDRVGGRTATIPGPPGSGLSFDAGGSFINSGDADLRSLIRRLGLQEAPDEADWEADYAFSRGDGYELLSEDRLFQRFKTQLLAVKKDQDRLGIRGGQLPSPLSSAAREFDAMSAQAYLERLGAPPAFRELVQMYIGSYYGVSLSEANALHVLTGLTIDPRRSAFGFAEEEYADEAYILPGGAQRISLEIEKRLPAVLKRHVLTAVDSAEGGRFLLTFESPAGDVLVEADYVILTVPFPVLRRSVALRAPVSPRARRALSTARQGRNSKMVLFFNRPVWKEIYGRSGCVLTSRFTAYSPQGAQGPSNALMIYFHGQQDLSRPAAALADVMGALEKIFPGISSQLTAATAADWVNDRFSLGSFSGVKAPGQWESGWPEVKDLRSGNLLFAGEQLGGELWGGYMNGAVRSGFSAARLVAESIAERVRRGSSAKTLRLDTVPAWQGAAALWRDR